MKPYIQKLINMKLLDHKGGFALEVGSGNGEDAAVFESLGYTVLKFDLKEGIDLRTFKFPENKYDFINCNNVLPFIHDKAEVIKALRAMAGSLKTGGTMHFTLFGENDPWKVVYPEKMSFWSFDDINNFIDSIPLKCVQKSSEEYMGKTMAGDDKYWHMLRYVLIKV